MNVRWERWRRDLLFVLVGVVIASAVLVPVGWSYYRAEQQRAEATSDRIEALEHQLEQEREREQAERQALEAAKMEADRAARAEKYDRRVRDRNSIIFRYGDMGQKGGATDGTTEWYEVAKPQP